MERNKIMPHLATLGMLLIAIGIVLPLFKSVQFTPFKYFYAAGAAILLIARIFTPAAEGSLRVKRLWRMQTWSAIFFCVGAFFLFYPPAFDSNFRDVVGFTVAGAAIQIYVSVMMAIIEKKEK